jgi:nucleoside-specific outer membrane channel protein Tsx
MNFKQSQLFTCLSLWLVILTHSNLANSAVFEWSNSEIQYLYGNGYRKPNNTNQISQSIITITHADGWSLGRNFFFMDTAISDAGQPPQTSVYGEAYSYLTLGKVLGKDLSLGIFKDINAVAGVNAGETINSQKSGSRIFLYGLSLEFKLPGFKLLNVDVLQPIPSPIGMNDF